VRLGILLILLQSVLLCAEGRAEPAAVPLDYADAQVGMLAPDRDTAEPDEPDPQAVTVDRYTFRAATTAVVPSCNSYHPVSVARIAHTIRGPPVRQ